MKRFCLFIWVLIIVIIFSGQGSAEEKISSIEHSVVLTIGSNTGFYDGKPFPTAPALLKNNRFYIPLGPLRDLGLVDTIWNAGKKSIDVAVPEKGVHVRYEEDSPFLLLLRGDGGDFGRIPGPAPFVQKNTFFIPAKSLKYLWGANLSYADRTLTIRWSSPAAEDKSISPEEPAAAPEQPDEALARRLADSNMGLEDMDHLIIIESNFSDLNQDGGPDEMYVIAHPLEVNKNYFSTPGYLIYAISPGGKFHSVQLDFPPIDLAKGNIKIQYGDISGDKIPEIFYSVDYAQPEHVERWPHMLEYHPESGEFSDLDITKENDLMVRNWGIENTDEAAELWLDIKRNLSDDQGMRRYFRLYRDRLVKRENYFRMTNPDVNHDHDPEVTFSDVNLENIVRGEIDKYEGPVYQSELKGITRLFAGGKTISNLKGLEYLVDLEEIDFSGNSIRDLSPVETLTHLQEADFSGNDIRDLSPLSKLSGLKRLGLSSCNIADLGSMGAMPGLDSLDLDFNRIADVRPLAKLKGLHDLSLYGNKIQNAEPLAALTGLENLLLQENQIKDVRPLRGLTRLKSLGLTGNPVANFNVLSSLEDTFIY